MKGMGKLNYPPKYIHFQGKRKQLYSLVWNLEKKLKQKILRFFLKMLNTQMV